MKVVLFAGGMGTRLRGYVDDVPKPMAEVGSRPIIWHLMKYYAHYGHNEFIICLGYKGKAIKEYFLNYKATTSADFIWHGGQTVTVLDSDGTENWTVRFVETGDDANIGMRLKAVEHALGDDKMFLANYADGLSDLNLTTMIDDLTDSDSIASVLAVQPTASFDILRLNREKGTVRQVDPLSSTDIYINGGFFVFRRAIFDYMQEGEELVREPFARLIDAGKLKFYEPSCWWQCMDTFKDLQVLNALDSKRTAPWKVWANKPRLVAAIEPVTVSTDIPMKRIAG